MIENPSTTKLLYDDLSSRISYWSAEGNDLEYFQVIGVLSLLLDDIRMDYRVQLDEDFPE